MEIKIFDPAGNLTRAAGLEVRDCTEHATTTDLTNFTGYYSTICNYRPTISSRRLVVCLPLVEQRLGHSIWVSWWTNRNLGRFSRCFSCFPYHKFHTTISPHLSPFHFIWPCDDASGVFGQHLYLQTFKYRDFIASHPSSRPSVGHALTTYYRF